MNAEVPKPVYVEDVRSLLIEFFNGELKEMERALEFSKVKGQPLCLVQIKRGKWLTNYSDIYARLKEIGAQYKGGRRLWEVPLANQEKAVGFEPTKPAPGYYRVNPGYYPQFPIDKILSSKFSFRLNIAEGIEELMGEVHAAGRIIEPLICRPSTKPGHVELGPGERRLLAARNLAMKTVPILVAEFTDEEFDKIRLLENLARKDLTDYELGRVLSYLLKEYPDRYPTQEALAQEFGKTKGWVSQHISHFQFVEKELMPRGFTAVSKVTEGQTRAIRELPPEKREEVLTAVKSTHRVPSWTETKKFVEPEAAEPAQPRRREAKPEPIMTGVEVECGECHRKFALNHLEYPDGKIQHKLEGLRET